jgi:hypothetical protein
MNGSVSGGISHIDGHNNATRISDPMHIALGNRRETDIDNNE